MSRATWLLVGGWLLVLSLVRGVMYSAVILPWQAPDEPWHFERVELTRVRDLDVSWRDRDPNLQAAIEKSMQEFRFWQFFPLHPLGEEGGQFHQPSFYYRTVADVLRITRQSDLFSRFMMARLMSVVFTTAVVMIAWLCARILFPNDPFLQVGIPAFVALQPMFSYIGSTVNNDNLVKVFTSLVLLAMTWMLMRGSSLPNLALLVGAVMLSWNTKRVSVFMVPAVALAIPLTFIFHPPRTIIGRLGIIATVIGALIGIMTVFRSGLLVMWWNRTWQRILYSRELPDFGEMLDVFGRVWRTYVTAIFKSFWASFGWMNVEVHPAWYMLMMLVSLVALAGLFRLFLDRSSVKANVDLRQWMVLGLYGLSVLVLLALAFGNFLFAETGDFIWAKGHLPQGRYLFPAIIPLASLFVLGLQTWVPSEPHMQRLALISLVGGLWTLDLIWFVGRLIPAFYGGVG